MLPLTTNRTWAIGLQGQKQERKKGPSPQTAIWAIGLGGEKKAPPPITIERLASVQNKKKTKALQQSQFGWLPDAPKKIIQMKQKTTKPITMWAISLDAKKMVN